MRLLLGTGQLAESGSAESWLQSRIETGRDYRAGKRVWERSPPCWTCQAGRGSLLSRGLKTWTLRIDISVSESERQRVLEK